MATNSPPHSTQRREVSAAQLSKPSPPTGERIQGREEKRSRIEEGILFARNFLKHPNLVGWMLPSSPFVVAQVLKQVDWKRARVIVEYGPGVGTFTKEILRRMHPDATLMALEVNGDFVQFLRQSLPDPRLHVIH